MKKNGFAILMIISTVLLFITPVFSASLPTKQWTYMVYIAGDNNLDNYVVSDIEQEFASVGSDENVNIVVLADRASNSGSWTSTKVFYVTKGMKATSSAAVADWGEMNMGSSQTLSKFVNYSKTNYPAQKYALIMWNHGGGWYRGSNMVDDTNDDALDIDETAEALNTAGTIDTVGIDACASQTIETESMWGKYAKAMSASQDLQYGEGIKHDNILRELTKNPGMNALDLANIISKARSESTSSTVDLDTSWSNLQEAINVLAISLINNYDKYKDAYSSAVKKTQIVVNESDKDLFDLVTNLKNSVSDQTIKNNCSAVINAMASTVKYNDNRNSSKRYNGITIWCPDNLSYFNRYSSYYKTLNFSKNTYWDEFLGVLANGKSIAPIAQPKVVTTTNAIATQKPITTPKPISTTKPTTTAKSTLKPQTTKAPSESNSELYNRKLTGNNSVVGKPDDSQVLHRQEPNLEATLKPTINADLSYMTDEKLELTEKITPTANQILTQTNITDTINVTSSSSFFEIIANIINMLFNLIKTLFGS